MIKTYTTQSSARRALAKIGDAALRAAKDLIYVDDNEMFAFDQAAAERIEDGVILGGGDIGGEVTSTEVILAKLEQIEEDDKNEVDDAPCSDVAEEDQQLVNEYGMTHCAHCGISLHNGVGNHMQEVNGKHIYHEKFEFACLACGEEFGPTIHRAETRSIGTRKASVTQSETMKATMKLNREIQASEGDKVLGTWPNACRMWKLNSSWMTSAQQDGLTAKLYDAAKKGERLVVEINGRTFQLVNV